jgi:glycosyltransferase involved in cell wall biosynthesis
MNRKISIITINFNNKDGLEKTIKSIVDQNFTDYEYIIIDGGSTDGSVDVIKQYADKINYWISEPDKGIYNAMNKGILQAKGEYCLFLNSGDWLAEKNVLEQACPYLKESIDIISGNLYLCNPIKKEMKLWDDNIVPDLKYFIISTLPHPSTFIRTALFKEIGLYNENYKIASDFDFFIKALIISKKTFQKTSIRISVFNMDGISSQIEFNATGIEERDQIIAQYFPEPVYSILTEYRNTLKNFNSFIYSKRNLWKKIKDKYNFIKFHRNNKIRYRDYFRENHYD